MKSYHRWQIMFASRMKMTLLTIVIASSLLFVNSAFAFTKQKTSQSYLSLPTTVGRQSEIADDGGGPPPAVLHEDRYLSSTNDDDSSDDGPPPAVLRSEKSHSATSDDSDWTTADNNTIPEKYMKGLSNCESTAAADGHLTLVEIMDCFHQVF